MTDLLPCPFCGSTNLRHEFAGSQGFIECNECGTVGPCDERAADPICDYDAAYAAWNRRAAAQADGPAVPEGREPASVVSEPSDEELLEKGPSLEEVEELCEEHCFNVEGYESIECLQGLINDAISRWGRPAAPPAPTAKELKELEGWLQEMLGSPSAAAAAQWETNIKYLAKFLRMVDSAFLRQQLLQQENHRFREPERTILCDILANGTLLPDPDGTRYWDPSNAPAVVPVAVSERLPGEEDCDAEGRCWLLTVEDEYPQWRLHSVEGHQPGGRMIWVPVDRTPGVMVDAFYASHWLPAHALPLPQGEVE